MPPDPADRSRGVRSRQPARRALLRLGVAGLAASGLAGCGVRWEDLRLDDVPTPTPPQLSSDDLARFGAVVDVQSLLDLAVAVGPDEQASAAAGRHREHLEQLGPLPGPVPSPSATPSGWPTTSPAPTGPVDLATLQAAELAVSTRLLASAAGEGAAVGGALAGLLASVGASCAVTAALLGADLPELVLPDDVDPSGLRAAADQVVALVEAHRAAAFGYAVLAVRLRDAVRDAAREAIAEHDRAADHLVALADAAGAQVPPARAAYLVQRPADGPAALTLALALELDVANAAHALVTAATGQWRTLAAGHLARTAVDATAWGVVPAFPGAPGLG